MRLANRALIAVVALAALVVPAAADATYPGENGKIYFAGINAVSGGYDVWSVNPDGSGLVNLTDLPGGAGEGFSPAVSSDGTRVAFGAGSQATAEIWVMNGDGSSPLQLTDDGSIDQKPAISPDGSRVVWEDWSADQTVRDIWTMGADGGGKTGLITTSHQDLQPTFTPDGDSVVFVNEPDGLHLDVAIAPSTGGPYTAVTAITDAERQELDPSVSPDGSRVAFTDWADFSFTTKPDVVTSDFSGDDRQPIADDPGIREEYPAWSPDATKIAYTTDVDGGQLVIADADGANPVAIPLDPGVVFSPIEPDWAPAIVAPPPPPPGGGPADTTSPDTKITKRPKNKSEKTKAKYRFKSNEPGSSFECKLDKKKFKPCESPRRYKHLKAKRHKFKVRATDAAGNTDPTAAKDRFRTLAK